MEDKENIMTMKLSVSVRDAPAFMAVIEAACEVVRMANTLGFVSGDAPEIRELHAALDCLSPDFELGDETPSKS
jgi:hypothetical protein